MSDQSAETSTEKQEKKASVPRPKPVAKKQAPARSDAKQLSSDKTRTAKTKPAKKEPGTPEKQPHQPLKTPGPPQPLSAENGSAVDYDDFLADVSEDIDNVKDRFEGTDADASEIVEYEPDQWFLPEEEEYPEAPEAVEPTTPPKKTSPEKQADPVKSAKPEKPPKAKKKTASPATATQKPKKQSERPPSPSAEKKSKPVSKKPLTQRPIPSAGETKPKDQKPPKPPADAKAKKPLRPAIENLEELYEDAIAQHLADETPTRPSRRISAKFLLGGIFTIVLLLAAGFLIMKDPFGLFEPDSASTSVAQKPPDAPPGSGPVYKVPSPPSPSPAKTPGEEEISQAVKITNPQTPSPIAVQEPQPAPKTAVTVPQQPQAGKDPGTSTSETEPTVVSTPPQPAKAEPFSRPLPEQKGTAPQPRTDTQVAMAQPVRVETEASPAATQDKPIQPETSAEPKPVPIDEQVKVFLEKWAAAWEATAGPDGNFSAYESCYSDNFMARGMDKTAFIQDKQVKNKRKKWITIGVQDISVKEIGAPNRVKASFTQDYSSSNYSSSSPKTLVLANEPGGWKIIGVSP